MSGFTLAGVPFWTTGREADLAVAISSVAWALIEGRYGIVARLYRVDLRGGLPVPLMRYIAVAVVIGMWLEMFTLTSFNANIVVLRTANVFHLPQAGGFGHWLIWLAVVLVFTRHGLSDPFRGAYVAGLLVAVHEGAWFVADFAALPSEMPPTLYYYSPFLILLAAFAFTYFYLHVDALPKSQLVLVLIFQAAFSILWVAAGWPVTVDNITGPTSLYLSLPVNLIEVMSWMLLGILFL